MEVKDLKGDGKLELIASFAWTGYEGAQCCEAACDAIYGWTGWNYTDISSQFKQFYERKLALLNKEGTDENVDC